MNVGSAGQQGVQVYAAEHFVVGNSCPERGCKGFCL